ncbi:MAG: ribosome silencing factor [Fimbriimonadaceae bacterium]
MTTEQKLDSIRELLDEMKAEQIETLDVSNKTVLADYFVICTALNDRHVSAISDKVSQAMRDRKSKPYRVEGDKTGWVLQDFGDIVLHIMRDEERQFYDLESLWSATKKLQSTSSEDGSA